MDEDLQHSPLDIEAMIRHATSTGYDIVYAKPVQNVHQAKTRDWTSRGFKSLLALLTGNRFVRDFNSFRLIRGQLARAASSVVGHETYFDVALSWYTKRIGVVPLSLKDERFIKTGKSAYTPRKLLSHARRLLISSQVKIVRLFGFFGLIIFLMSLMGFLWIFIAKATALNTYAPSGWSSLMVTILFFGGFITLLLAITLEYITTLVLTANGKPIFFSVDRATDAILARYFAEHQP
jgi:hypothetical protein